MNEPPGARMRVGLTALTMAEYFRDVNEQDVLNDQNIFFLLFIRFSHFPCPGTQRHLINKDLLSYFIYLYRTSFQIFSQKLELLGFPNSIINKKILKSYRVYYSK
ncbi:hypothetical protein QJS04_geneDACA004059 [Acorus gramineus]|uniref:H(+)-transporting two-sector ATPase n=1 Tax=Acorus gramineus TaxID=55184 RepID=A0AAV9BIN9_ACOGR|nr:hypothetical protein QJS04_geneDACA004059 [Acorus gramineus]